MCSKRVVACEPCTAKAKLVGKHASYFVAALPTAEGHSQPKKFYCACIYGSARKSASPFVVSIGHDSACR